jgi:hypothetical protein
MLEAITNLHQFYGAKLLVKRSTKILGESLLKPTNISGSDA